jgi:hypothetical protein
MFMQLISRLGGKEGPAQLDTVSQHTSFLFACTGVTCEL